MITSEEALARLDGCRIERSTFPRRRRPTSRGGSAKPPFAKYRARLLEDIEQGRWQELDEAFYTVLEFGTGGRRGKMYPVGTNVLNERTIAESARGLADYVTSRKEARNHRGRA